MSDIIKFPPRKITVQISNLDIIKSHDATHLILEKLRKASMPDSNVGFITEYRHPDPTIDTITYTWSSDLSHV